MAVTALVMNGAGITLFISLLLALASDQMQKFRKKTVSGYPLLHSSVHLDGMKASTIKTIADDTSIMIDPVTGNTTSGAIMILF